MQTIKYKFADGTTTEVAVTDEIYLIHSELVQMEKRNHWRETRRHTSLNMLMELGIGFEDKSADTFAAIIRRENCDRVREALSKLSDKRREIVHSVYYKGLTMRETARQMGVSHSSVSQRMKTIRNILQKELCDCINN